MSNVFTWKEFAGFGMGYWIRDVELLRKQVETLAKNIYMSQVDKDPSECSIFYLALQKKKVLLGLWKIVTTHPEKKKMVDFLSKDFEQDANKTVALKNAFVLLGKQRFEYAAALFLLAGKLKDAVMVCIRNLKDLQLAITICRLYEGDDGPVLKELLDNALKETELVSTVAEDDLYWYQSMIYWMKQDFYESSRLLFSSKEIIDESAYIIYKHIEKTFVNFPYKKKDIFRLQDEGKVLLGLSNSYLNMRCYGIALKIVLLEYPKLDIVTADLVEGSKSKTASGYLYRILAGYGQCILDAYDMWHSSLDHKFVVNYLYEMEKSKQELCEYAKIPISTFNDFLEKLSLERASLDPFLILLKAQKNIPNNILMNSIIADLVEVRTDELVHVYGLQCRCEECNQVPTIQLQTNAMFKFYEYYYDMVVESCLHTSTKAIIVMNMISVVLIHMCSLVKAEKIETGIKKLRYRYQRGRLG